ncbi:putative F-box protein At3g16210 [Rosa rugosa]|uniref:putative F-box protein At3g16210 n=1 Tax=Rosa rugosa TaxID=74645 RepID=UPI002B4028EB|nr:putative F-box protein At3g16210 [Rosa rugosa]
MTEFCKMQEEALVAQILSRLPPRSLMRFKCIRKSWHALINSPWFASRPTPPSVQQTLLLYSNPIEALRIRTEANKEEIVFSFLNLPNNAGHCDGIICLNLYTGNLVLYNPANKELKILPKPCLPVEDKDTFITVLGFGYDSKSNDYILVNIAVYGEELLGDYENTILHIPKAEMYTLGTDSWKEIQTDYLETGSAIFWPTDFEMYFRGNFY